MTLPRRRFLAITAAAAGTVVAGRAAAGPVRWRGRALGAEVALTLHGPEAPTRAALAVCLAEVRRVEALFSLHDPGSALVALNRAGRLAAPGPDWRALLDECDAVHRATGGRFDPTIQPLWQALAHGGDPAEARRRVGWDRVAIGPDAVILGAGQALSFNGIAQGYATDRVRGVLRDRGFSRALVDLGEIAGIGGPWRVGLADPGAGTLGALTLRDAALATSSPGAMRLGPAHHILDPTGARQAPAWSTISVEAHSATRADALSTALVHCSDAEIAASLRALDGVSQVRAVDADGNLRRFGA